MSADWTALGRRTYLDANLYIHAFEGIETHRRTMVELLAAIDRQDTIVIASELLLTELLPRPIKEGRQDLVERYLELIRRTRRIHSVPVDRPSDPALGSPAGGLRIAIDGRPACGDRPRPWLRDLRHQRSTPRARRRDPRTCAGRAGEWVTQLDRRGHPSPHSPRAGAVSS